MRLAIFHNHPIHYKHLLFQELNREGVDLEVLFLASQSSIRHEEIPLSAELYRSQIGYQGAYESAPSLTRARFAWNSLRKFRPEVVIISGFEALECWTAWTHAILKGIPVVLWYQCNEFDSPRHWPKELLKRLFLSKCAQAHVYGASSRDYVIKLGMPTERVRIVRTVLDVAHFLSNPIEKPSPVNPIRRLIYVGRLAPEKNVGFLLSAFSRAVRSAGSSQLTLTLVGVGPSEPALRSECSRLGIEHLVEFKGYCPQKDLPQLYNAADFFILPSVREPWGLVALEAMLCGLPVLISTQCGCAADVVTPETGWTFSPWNEDKLVELLCTLPKLPIERVREMGDAAQQLASQYSASACARRVIEAISEIPSQGEPRPVTYAG